MPSPRILLVLNPHSRKNRRRGDRAAELRAILGDLGEVRITSETRELAPLLEEALAHDLACLVSDGGDGALHWALNTARPICEARGAPLPVALPTNGGTIDFVARKAGVHGDAVRIVRRLVTRVRREGATPSVELDSLDLTGELEDGTPFRKLGFALAAGGIGNRFFDDYYASPDPGAATIVSVISRTVASLALGSLPGVPARVGERARRMFAPHRARVVIDGEVVPSEVHGGIHAGAFDVDLGGVLRVFPFARERGVLHFQAGAIRPPEIVANLPNLFAGRAIQSEGLRDTRGTEMIIEALGEELLRPVLDGEIYEGVRRLVVRPGPTIRIATP